MKLNVENGFRKYVEAVEQLYPNTKNYNVVVKWADYKDFNARKLSGEIHIPKQKLPNPPKQATIYLNPDTNYLDLLGVLCHELAHLVQHSQNKKLKHNKKFGIIEEKLRNKWQDLMLANQKTIEEEI